MSEMTSNDWVFAGNSGSQPGQLWQHKKGGLYWVVERRATRAPLFEGESLYLDSLPEQAATVTDDIAANEEMVFYVSANPAFVKKWWVRPARMFDDGRFVQVES